MPDTEHHFGWVRDLPNPDYPQYVPSPRLLASRPSSMDLESLYPPVYDQGQLGSCTAQAIAGDIHADEIAANITNPVIPSRLMIYWLERSLEGTVDADAGAAISDGLKVVNTYGYCDEKLWPYDISRFRDKPPTAAFDAAVPNKIKDYGRVQQDVDHFATALASGLGVIFGFTCFESLESRQTALTGMIPMPKRGEQVIGGHAVVAVGYDDSTQLVKIRNSWGTSWGKNGYGWLPYQYVFHPSLAADFWVILDVPNPNPPPPPPPPTPTGKVRVILDVDAITKTASVVSVG